MDYASEGRMVRGCEEGLSIRDGSPPPPLGREDTDCVLWLAMQLVHIDSQTRRRSRLGPHILTLFPCTSSTKHPPFPRNRMLGVRNDSHLDRMTEVESTADLVKQELNIPHKTQIHHNRKPFKLEWK